MATSSLEIPIRVTMDATQAKDTVNDVNSSIDSLGTNVVSMGRRAVGGFGGVMAAEDRLYNAQQRVNVANINYVLTVRQFGAGSIQAARALDQVRVAQNGVELAQLRLNVRYLQFALSVGPQLFKTMTSITAAVAKQIGLNYAEATSWYAKAAAIGLTIGLLTLGLGVLAGLSAGAVVNQQIQQQNQFYGMGQANPTAISQYTSAQLATQMKAAYSP